MFHHVLHVAGGVFIQLHSELPCQSEKGSTDSVSQGQSDAKGSCSGEELFLLLRIERRVWGEGEGRGGTVS